MSIFGTAVHRAWVYYLDAKLADTDDNHIVSFLEFYNWIAYWVENLAPLLHCFQLGRDLPGHLLIGS